MIAQSVRFIKKMTYSIGKIQ